MQFKNCNSKDVGDYIVSLRKYFIDYLNIDISQFENILKLRHKDLNYFNFNGLRKVPAQIVSYDDIVAGIILIVTDGKNNIAPYLNPHVALYNKYERCAEIMENATKKWVLENTMLKLNEETKLFVKYSTLKRDGYLFKLENPWTEEEFNDDARVEVIKDDGEYFYTFVEDSLTFKDGKKVNAFILERKKRND